MLGEMKNMEPAARIKKVSKLYPSGDKEITALKDTSLEMNRGELMLIIGPSGSGKTTLLLVTGGIIEPSTGDVFIGDHNLKGLSEKRKTLLRLQNIGFVFQNINLIEPLKIIENVAFPARLLYGERTKANKVAAEMIEKVGLRDKIDSYPNDISGGEQQRIAVARALVTDPSILLCDEPTASLDGDSLKTIMKELKMSAEEGKAVVVVSHDRRLEEYSDRIIEVIDGKIKNDQA